VIDKIINFAFQQGYTIKNLSFSPITGGDGNIEFLLHLKWEGEREAGVNELLVSPIEVVKQSHQEFKTKQNLEG
ncbi:MAG: TlyA family rRNA (cytidine-2'-O)-methyltransferase, partial [Bacillus sp. (in: firmicutes)]